MKESIKEKVKAYDEALKRAVVAHKDEDRHLKAALERIFPELKESEDERIRKALIDYFDDANKADENPLQSYGIHTDKAIAWLEKQDKQNPCESCEEARLNCQNFPCERKKNFDSANKVEPKFNFKVGQWIVTTGKCVYLIAKIDGFNVTLVDTNGNEYVFDASSLDDAHEWNIADAKNGDVLACNNGWTCIFKTLVNDETFSSYCFMDNTKWFCETGSEGHTLKEEFVKAYNGKIYPATKEQRNLLFQKMKDDGYEWDAEKLELKEIEQKPVEWHREDEQNLNACLGYIPDEFLRRWLIDAIIHLK